MEGVTTKNKVEILNDWRERRDKGPTQARTLLSERHPHFELLDYDGKKQVIDHLIDELEGDNKNYYIAKELARLKGVIFETEEIDRAMQGLR